MSTHFSADEIFRIGMEVELNGKDFYDAAASMCEARETKGTLEYLRDQEAEHYHVFSEMRDQLSAEAKAETVYDPDGQMSAYLRAIADSRVFTNQTEAAEAAKNCESAADVLRIALRFEKDSVLMFQAMKALVPEKWGQSKIDGLISAEQGHIREISDMLAELG